MDVTDGAAAADCRLDDGGEEVWSGSPLRCGDHSGATDFWGFFLNNDVFKKTQVDTSEEMISSNSQLKCNQYVYSSD